MTNISCSSSNPANGPSRRDEVVLHRCPISSFLVLSFPSRSVGELRIRILELKGQPRAIQTSGGLASGGSAAPPRPAQGAIGAQVGRTSERGAYNTRTVPSQSSRNHHRCFIIGLVCFLLGRECNVSYQRAAPPSPLQSPLARVLLFGPAGPRRRSGRRCQRRSNEGNRRWHAIDRGCWRWRAIDWGCWRWHAIDWGRTASGRRGNVHWDHVG